jgi:hypothetical protein
VKLDGAQAGAGVLSASGRDPLGLASGSETSGSKDRHWMQVPLGEQSKLLGMLIVSAPIDAILSEDEADLTHTLEERRVVAAIRRAASSETQMRNIFAVVANELDSIVPFDRFVGTITDTESADLVISYVQGIPREGK